MSRPVTHSVRDSFRPDTTDVDNGYFISIDDVCPICLQSEPQAATVKLKHCGHVLHKDCLGEWIQVSMEEGRTPTCPVDRSTLIQIRTSEPSEPSDEELAKMRRLVNEAREEFLRAWEALRQPLDFGGPGTTARQE